MLGTKMLINDFSNYLKLLLQYYEQLKNQLKTRIFVNFKPIPTYLHFQTIIL